MDNDARVAIEGLVVGMAEAGVVSFDQLHTILRSIEFSQTGPAGQIPEASADVRDMVEKIRDITGCRPAS